MTFEFREPKREAAPVLVGLSGPSGSGKTYSALLMARGLAGGKPFAIIDTENGRALHYADYFPEMRHAHLRAPFNPAAYLEAISDADEQGFPVIVVDSASHEWEGEGGVLEMQEAAFKRMGSRESARMASWIEPKSEHKTMVRRLLQVKAHVILCLRAEDKIEMVNVNGKTEVRAKETLTSILGWIPICERRLPFELTVSLLVTPDKPGVPKPIKLQKQHKAFIPLDRPLEEETGRLLGEWAQGSDGVVDRRAANAPPESAEGEPRARAGDRDRAPGSDAAATASSPSAEAMSAPEFTRWRQRMQIATPQIVETARRLFPGKSSLAALTDDERGTLCAAIAHEGVQQELAEPVASSQGTEIPY